MFYVGEKPWHKLGTQLEKPATAAQALKAANLNWKVTKVPMFGISNSSVITSNKFGVVREDKIGLPDCQIFGVVSESYEPLQNIEAFKFFDNIVGQGEAIYHTAGALGVGERIWILAKLPNDIVVKGEDIVNKFLLLSNSHDGTKSVQIKFTPIRVVCQNTLNQAISGSGKTFSVTHQKNIHRKLSETSNLLGIIRTGFDEIENLFKSMVEMNLNVAEVENYYAKVFPIPQNVKSEESERKKKQMEKLHLESKVFFEKGVGNDKLGVRGTLWAAYNGITEYVDYHKVLRKSTDRSSYLLFGSGADIKEKALEVAKDFLTH